MPKTNVPKQFDAKGQSVQPYDELVGKVYARDDILPRAKEDLLKAINVMKFIEFNLDWIACAVENKSNFTGYRFEDDRDKGVLRDQDGTSFHINSYQYGEQVYTTFNIFIREFKEIINAVLIAALADDCPFKDPIRMFAEAFIHNDHIGCLEARLMMPREIGKHIILNLPPKLDDLMRGFLEKYASKNMTSAKAVEYVQPYLGEVVLDSSQEQVQLTQELVEEYCRDILALDEPDNEHDIVTDPVTSEASDVLKRALPALIEVRQGYFGMIQFHFKFADDARVFLRECKNHPELQKIDIQKARLDIKGERYIVRLTEGQMQIIAASAASLETISEELEKTKEKRKSFAPNRARYLDILSRSKNVEEVSGSCVVELYSEEDAQLFYDLLGSLSGAPQSKPLLQARQVTLCVSLLSMIYNRHYVNLISTLEFERSLLVEGVTPFHDAAMMPMGKGLEELYHKASGDVLSRAAIIPNKFGETPLLCAAVNQLPIDFMKLIDVICLTTIRNMMISYFDGRGLEESIAPDDDGLLAFINSACIASLNKAILIVTTSAKESILLMAAHYQSGESLQYLVDHINDDELNQAMVHKDTSSWTPMHKAARYQRSYGFFALLNRMWLSTLRKIVDIRCAKGWTFMHLVARHQRADVFLSVIHRLTTPQELYDGELVDIDLTPEDLNRKFNDTLSKRNVYGLTPWHYALQYQEPICIRELLDHTTQDTLRNLNYCLISDGGFAYQLFYLACLHLDTPTFNLFIEKYSYTKVEFDGLLRETKENLDEFHLRKFIRALCRHISVGCHKYLTGESSAAPNDSQKTLDVEDSVLELFSSGNAMVKVVHPADIDSTLAPLIDYNHRPKFRDRKKGPYRYNHLTEGVGLYKPAQNPEGVTHQYTKKTSATIISPKLCTPVFGYHDGGRPLVGLLFDSSECKIKLMLTGDSGTVRKRWVGSYDKLRAYEADKRTLNHTDFAEFRAAIKHASVNVNEVLAGLSREGIKAVIIARDTVENIKLASEYVAKIKEKLEIELPIYHYDAIARKCQRVAPHINLQLETPRESPHALAG